MCDDYEINGIERVIITMPEKWHRRFGVREQEYYIDFVTGRQYCWLHDGEYADPEKYPMGVRRDGMERLHALEYNLISYFLILQYSDRLALGERTARRLGMHQYPMLPERRR